MVQYCIVAPLIRIVLQVYTLTYRNCLQTYTFIANYIWLGLRLSRVWRPTKHIIGHIGDRFYGSNDPTNSVKALKEVMVLCIRLQSHPGPPHHVTILHVHAIYSQTQNNTYTKMNLSTVKWAQWDKTQSRELLGLFICVCSSQCTIVAHNTAQNRPDNFLSCPQTITIAPMMYIWYYVCIILCKFFMAAL